MNSGGWSVHDHVLLRRAGFPFALVEPGPGTVDAAAADRAEHLVDAWRQLERAAGRLLRDEIHREVDRTRAAGRDRTRLRRLSTLRTDLGHRRWPRAARSARALVGDDGDFGRAAADYVRRHEAVRRAETDLLADQSDVLASERGRILAALERPDVRDALVQLSPSFAEQVRRVAERGQDGPPRARDRRFTRTAYLFLQRLAAKNETTGFFGPLTHGVVEGDRTGIGFGPETATGHRRRRAFLSFWAVAELARAVAADPVFAEHLLVRRSPLIGLADAGIVLPDGRVVDLDTADIAILDGLSAPTTVAALVGSLGAVGSAPVVRRRLDRLVRAGVLLADLEPSSTRPQPLTELRARIRTVDGGDTWRAALRDVADRVRDYGDATSAETRLDALGAVERRFEELTARPARRDGGRMYADRLVVFEECEGDAPVSVGGDVVRRWSDQLGPYLDLCAAYGELRWRGLRTLVTELVTEPCGFLSFAERLAAAIEAGGLNRHREAERPLLDAYTAVVERAEQDGVARLRPEDLAELVAASGAARTRPRFVSPDLMPAGPAGDSLVLGEIHPYVFAWGSQRLFGPRGLAAAAAADLSPWGGPAAIATVLRRRQHKGMVSDAFPGRFVEVGGTASVDRARRVPVADLVVRPGPDGPSLHGPTGPLVLYTGEDDHPHLRAFAPPHVEALPVRIADHRPRVQVGDLVVARRRWWLNADPAPALDQDRAVAEVCRLRGRTGIPRHVFVRLPGEPKPVYLDLTSPTACSLLARRPEGTVVVEEMLPGPDQLWLRRRAGAFTSEFRIAMTRKEPG